MVNYYEQHPASLYGKPITFYLSKRLLVIEVTAAQRHQSLVRELHRRSNTERVSLRLTLRRTSGHQTG